MSNKKKIATMLLVAIVAIGSYFVAGTYAKYTSSIAGEDTASVAKWKWIINNSTIDSTTAAQNGYTFDLFSTIKEADTTTTESDVASGKKIAPGTGGSIDINIQNKSEVNAKYEIRFAEINASSVPIEYSVDGTTWVSGANLNDLNVAETNIAIDGTATKTVKWRWAFTGDASSNYTSTQTDTTDTALGFGANTSAATVKLTATVVVTQAD